VGVCARDQLTSSLAVPRLAPHCVCVVQGRKKKKEKDVVFCWYCDREFDSETTLVQHQRVRPHPHPLVHTTPSPKHFHHTRTRFNSAHHTHGLCSGCLFSTCLLVFEVVNCNAVKPSAVVTSAPFVTQPQKWFGIDSLITTTHACHQAGRTTHPRMLQAHITTVNMTAALSSVVPRAPTRAFWCAHNSLTRKRPSSALPHPDLRAVISGALKLLTTLGPLLQV
jgi:hypothetical protein